MAVTLHTISNFFFFVFIGFNDFDQPDLGSCYMSSSAVQKSFLLLKYLSMGHYLISIKIYQCTFCFVCSFLGLMCIPSAKFGPYVDASEGWLVDWFVY